MAAPTSNNEVTARRLTRLLTGSDGNGGLWGKIKSMFVRKSGDTMTGTLGMTHPINQVIKGTGVAATSSTSGSTTTYYPAKWNFDLGIATPTAGDRMVIQIPVAGSDYGEYISTDNGTTYFPVARNVTTSRLTTHYPAKAYIMVVFEAYESVDGCGKVASIYPVAGGTARVTTTNGCWRVINDYDSGNNYERLYTGSYCYAGSTGINPYAMVALDSEGKYSMFISSGSGTGTGKTVNTTTKFAYPPNVLYYSANNTNAANARTASTSFYEAIPGADIRYSCNYIASNFTSWKPLFIECTRNADGTWTPTANSFTQTLREGYYYVYLGESSGYSLYLQAVNMLYYYDGSKLIAADSKLVTSSSTNGKVSVLGSDVTVYTHPTQTAQSAKGSATKVPQITTDSTGHVTGITEVTITGVTPASHAHGNIANGGTLTDTAAAAAGNDYVVIRDADNAKIQTSTIKGTDVADAVSKKHSHSTLTLSTTAQAYDGSHTLALPASDPYTSARTPASHTHGNIQNGGTLQSSDVAIANGDKLVVTDASDSNKVARTSVTFDGSTTTKVLKQKGTFEEVKEADVVWGGGFRTELSPIEFGNMARNLVHNPLPSAIKYERSNDGGTTWTTQQISDANKLALFNAASGGSSVGIPNSSYSGITDPSLLRGRITLYAVSSGDITAYENTWCYGQVKRILMYCSRSGAGKCLVELQSGPHLLAKDNVWSVQGTYDIAGDAGWNSIPLDTTFGGYSGQLADRYVAIRFTFWVQSGSTPRISIMRIGLLPQVFWTSRASNISMLGVPVSVYDNGTGYIDASGKLSTSRKLAVSLSNTSTDTSFNGTADVTNIKVSGTLGVANGGTGQTSLANVTVGAATKATQDSDGNAINTTYLKQLYQAEYGVSTFADIYAAITAKKTVYCRVPGSVANSSRMAFLAYTNISDPPTSSSLIEFQYYRSNSSGTGDSVFVYTITNNNNTWTTVERAASSSVKGNAESTYRTGQVNLTPANLGISATTSSVTVGSTTFNKYTDANAKSAIGISSSSTDNTFLKKDGTWASVTASSADKVANKLTIKLKTGSTEGTDLYTFDGSAAKTLDIKQGSNITLTAASGSLTIAGTADTKNTAGSTDTSSKIYLIGATSQAANPQTYSQDTTYVDTDATLASTKIRVAEKCTLQFNTTTNALDFVFA